MKQISSIQRMIKWGFKPLVLDFYVQSLWPTFSFERIKARVVEKIELNHNVVSLFIKPNFNFKNFQPGQHVLLTISINGQNFTRTYSPTLIKKNLLQITVKNITEGKVSSCIFNSLSKGSIVEISQPFGEMTWQNLPFSKHYIFCAAGIGITPLRSLIKAWSESPLLLDRKTIELHYWAQTEQDLCFKQELESITHNNIRVHFYTTREISKAAKSERLNKSLFDHLIETVFVACGPKSFVNDVQSIAINKKQRFYGEHADAPKVSADDITENSFFEVTYDGQIIQANANKTILESLEENGFSPVHGCRMGICKSCTCLKNTGASVNIKDQKLSTEPDEEIQICVSRPRSKITIQRY